MVKLDFKTKAELCFGGMNCDIGYVGFYPECFRGAERLFVIKGGPGTGKSHLMRQVASEAIERGEPVRLIHCASDAKSLDGVYLPSRRIGILDGTAPHRYEPEMPGIDGEIVNLGQFWNSGALQGQKETVLALNHEKSEGYASIYRLFGAMAELRAEVRTRLDASLDVGKMEKAARRAVDALRGEGECRVSQNRAIGMGGDVCLKDPELPNLIGISDEFGGGSRYLGALCDAAKEKGIACLTSYHPIYHDELQTLTFPASSIAYTAAPEPVVSRNIHMRRFRDWDMFVRLRPLCRDLSRMCDALRDEAISRFGNVRDAHFRLEGIYAGAMDFEGVGRYGRKIIAGMLGK